MVNEAVEHAMSLTHRGGASFVNAVLRRIARDTTLGAWPIDERDPVRRLAIELSHPDFLVERWWNRLGQERTELLPAAGGRRHGFAARGYARRESARRAHARTAAPAQAAPRTRSTR